MNQTQSTRASIARKEKMIDQLVEQLCDMATINKDSLISSGISRQTTKGVQLQETIASGLSSTRAYSALQPNSSRQNDLELRRALKSEIDRHLRNLDGSQLWRNINEVKESNNILKQKYFDEPNYNNNW